MGDFVPGIGGEAMLMRRIVIGLLGRRWLLMEARLRRRWAAQYLIFVISDMYGLRKFEKSNERYISSSFVHYIKAVLYLCLDLHKKWVVSYRA